MVHMRMCNLYKLEAEERACKYIFCTWVFPPVVSCITDRDNEQVLTKHEKNEVTKLVIP